MKRLFEWSFLIIAGIGASIVIFLQHSEAKSYLTAQEQILITVNLNDEFCNDKIYMAEAIASANIQNQLSPATKLWFDELVKREYITLSIITSFDESEIKYRAVNGDAFTIIPDKQIQKEKLVNGKASVDGKVLINGEIFYLDNEISSLVLLVTIKNNSEIVVEKTTWNYSAHLSGHTTNLVDNPYLDYWSDKIINPGEEYSFCHGAPLRTKTIELNNVSSNGIMPESKNLTWEIMRKRIKFKNN